MYLYVEFSNDIMWLCGSQNMVVIYKGRTLSRMIISSLMAWTKVNEYLEDQRPPLVLFFCPRSGPLAGVVIITPCSPRILQLFSSWTSIGMDILALCT